VVRGSFALENVYPKLYPKFLLCFPKLPWLRDDRKWFALGLDELSDHIKLFRAAGEYQHERRALDDAWMKELLTHLL